MQSARERSMRASLVVTCHRRAAFSTMLAFSQLRRRRLMQTETLAYEADGLHMVSHLYYDEQADGRRPGVLVFPEAFGLGAHAKSRAERLAGLGYVALACDLHGDGRVVHDLNEALGLVGPLRPSPAGPATPPTRPLPPCHAARRRTRPGSRALWSA